MKNRQQRKIRRRQRGEGLSFGLRQSEGKKRLPVVDESGQEKPDEKKPKMKKNTKEIRRPGRGRPHGAKAF